MPRRLMAALAAVAMATGTGVAQRPLLLYFLDVEGGQSTLVVTPGGESLLVDAGWAGNDARDARRIEAAARDAGITRIDVLLVTHFHRDHLGGVPELAQRLPIATFVDYGAPMPTTDPNVRHPFEAYAAVRERGRHVVAAPGVRLPLAGVDARVVSAGGATVTSPMAGGGERNPLCEPSERAPGEAVENPRSTGVHLTYGRFRFADLGDLSGRPLYALFCPSNLLGPLDLYLVPHHGGADTASPAGYATRPVVAVMNNGGTKGGAAEGFATLHAMREAGRIGDVWQVDKTRNEGARNFGDDRIANLDDRTGHWIKVSAGQDGAFTVTNGRTGQSQAYRPR
jgi:competence protein ComEC